MRSNFVQIWGGPWAWDQAGKKHYFQIWGDKRGDQAGEKQAVSDLGDQGGDQASEKSGRGCGGAEERSTYLGQSAVEYPSRRGHLQTSGTGGASVRGVRRPWANQCFPSFL